jgi:Tfp pilus assembly protein PilF
MSGSALPPDMRRQSRSRNNGQLLGQSNLQNRFHKRLNTLVSLTIALLCVSACAQSAPQKGDPAQNSSEREIRAALCDMYNGDYASAQQKIEKTLQTDPKNIYALRIYPSVIAGLSTTIARTGPG